ncbi:MAG: hypothetical protein Q8P71_02800, partial [bacterium]|nr:hypothetical protein [bacterium]
GEGARIGGARSDAYLMIRELRGNEQDGCSILRPSGKAQEWLISSFPLLTVAVLPLCRLTGELISFLSFSM